MSLVPESGSLTYPTHCPGLEALRAQADNCTYSSAKKKSGKRLNQRLPLIAGIVHPTADGERLHPGCAGFEQFLIAFIQPGVIVVRFDD